MIVLVLLIFEFLSIFSQKAVVDIESMRVRDLRRWLIKNGGYTEQEVLSILDKEELRKLVFDSIDEKAWDDTYLNAAEHFWYWFHRIGIVLLICLVISILRKPIENYLLSQWTHIKIFSRMSKSCWKSRRYSALFGIISLIILDICSTWISLSVMSSWITPILQPQYAYYIRRLCIPLPSMNLQPMNLLKGGNSDSSSSSSSSSSGLSSYSVNVTPIIAGFVIEGLKKALENLIGKEMIDIANKKNERKREKYNEEKYD